MKRLVGSFGTQTSSPAARPATHRPTPAATGLQQPTLGRTPARHRIDRMVLDVRRLRGDNEGKWAVTPLDAQWLTLVAGNPLQLAAATQRCFNEVECVAHSRWKGKRPDGAELGGLDDDPLAPRPTFSEMVPAPSKTRGWRTDPEGWRTGGNKREQHPADWTVLPDGRWESPKGRVFNPDTKMARSVVARRLALGLSVTTTDGKLDLSSVVELAEKAAADAGCSTHEWVTNTVRDVARTQLAGHHHEPATTTAAPAVDLDQLPTPATTPKPRPVRVKAARVPTRRHPVADGQVPLFDVDGVLEDPQLAVAS